MPGEQTSLPEVFISYGRLARGPKPDPTAGDEEWHKWCARAVTLELLAPLEAAIRARQYTPWRDETSLTSGDEIGERIDAALLSCAGAIVLIDPDALSRSSWVLWESSIITWRARIGMPARVVPVLIGVTAEQLSAHGYAPGRLDRKLAHTIDLADLDPDTPGFEQTMVEHAEAIVAALEELEGEPNGPVSIWIDAIASCLPEDPGWRAAVRSALRHGERLDLSPYPQRVVARELVVAGRERLLDILEAFTGFSPRDLPLLRTHLEPVWVPAESASGIPEAQARSPGERIVAVNASEPVAGDDIARRAWPRIPVRKRLQLTVVGASVAEAIADAMQSIREYWSLDLGDTIPDGSFVIVACSGNPVPELGQIVAALAGAYPEPTYLVMTGDPTPAGYEALVPPLPQPADGRARAFRQQVQRATVLSTGGTE